MNSPAPFASIFPPGLPPAGARLALTPSKSYSGSSFNITYADPCARHIPVPVLNYIRYAGLAPCAHIFPYQH